MSLSWLCRWCLGPLLRHARPWSPHALTALPHTEACGTQALHPSLQRCVNHEVCSDCLWHTFSSHNVSNRVQAVVLQVQNHPSCDQWNPSNSWECGMLQVCSTQLQQWCRQPSATMACRMWVIIPNSLACLWTYSNVVYIHDSSDRFKSISGRNCIVAAFSSRLWQQCCEYPDELGRLSLSDAVALPTCHSKIKLY